MSIAELGQYFVQSPIQKKISKIQ